MGPAAAPTGFTGTTIATLCARGGSKGLPGKNIRPLAGLPLIAHSIRHALAAPGVVGVYVSTDDDAIADVARAHGAQVPYRRPAHLATDAAPKLPVIEHLVAHLESQGQRIDTVVDLQPTSPLRSPDDIAQAVALLDRPGTDGRLPDLVLSVTPAHDNPYFNLAEPGAGGWLTLCKPHTATDRQSLPPVYALNGSLYVWRRAALHRSAAGPGLWANRIAPYPMPRARSVDIDDLGDFEYAEWLMQRRGAAA